ncbi:FecR domain-containing protein [Fulvivirgaceae bacterium BMA12]|uniref:FecR domain-containing protein n=1 Tax=Agaribacillus aureus TaxID=3051825 RepID=A0ABT8L5E7_9BACT|nr:FecR domain-containing protein [Fulvivirgaceae bacterium BMA12]
MKYEQYNTIDFIKDEYFIRWVKDPDEQSEKFWKMWIAKHPEKREEVMHARNMIADLGYKHDPKLSEHDYLEMFEGILKKSRQKSVKKPPLNAPVLSRALKVAAVVILALGSVFTLMKLKPEGKPPTITTVFVSKKSPVGQKIITWLDDGTKVHLNAGSDIRYAEKFSDSLRLIHLRGEAYFEVTRDTSRPFVVKTGKVKTTVLGTAFNVKAYPDENKIDVAVAEGKVKVENESSLTTTFQHTITQNQMASFDISNQLATKQEFDPNEVFAWTKGIIHFNGADINEIITTLERWYGVTFVVNRPLNLDKDFTITYENKPLTEILKGLSFAFDFRFEINDKIVTLN